MSSILTYPRSVSIESAMFWNWIVTATFVGLSVTDGERREVHLHGERRSEGSRIVLLGGAA